MNCIEVSKAATQISHLKHFPTRLLKKLKKTIDSQEPNWDKQKLNREKWIALQNCQKVVII